MQVASVVPVQQRLMSIVTTVGFWIVAVFVLFGGLGATGLWNSEDRWVEIAREMQMSGDYFLPTLNGIVYFDKPLLGYWLVVAGSALTGAIDEWSLRLPSAISGLVVLWSTIGLGRLLWSDSVARLAGWLLLTTYGLLMWSRLGEADMENCAAAILAVYWYWRYRDRTTFLNYWVFYLIIFVGAQTKGLAALIVPLLAVLPDLWREGRYRRHINFTHLLALFSGSLIYLLPFWLSHQGSTEPGTDAGLLMVFRENVVRYFAPFDHDDPFYTYFWALPVLFLPWAPLLLGALVQAVRGRAELSNNTRWLISAFVLVFLFFSISGSRRIYYILPLLPYCALLVAIFFESGNRWRWKRGFVRAQAWLLAALVTANLVLPLLKSPIEDHFDADFPPVLNLWVCGIIGGLALLWWLFAALHHRHAKEPAAMNLPALLGVALIVMGGFFLVQRDMIDEARTKWRFARDLRPLAETLHAPQIAMFGTGRVSAGILFYADLPVPVAMISDAAELERFLNSPPYPKLLLSSSRYTERMPQSLREKPPALREARNSWEDDKDDKFLAWRFAQPPAP